jgi:hypothetical protein
MEWNVVGNDEVTFSVQVKYRDGTAMVEVPRPEFNGKYLQTCSVVVFKDMNRGPDMRMAVEDLFIEGWMRHLRSRFDYWYSWWSQTWPKSKKEFPMHIIISYFFPKCSNQGNNEDLRREIRRYMS